MIRQSSSSFKSVLTSTSTVFLRISSPSSASGSLTSTLQSAIKNPYIICTGLKEGYSLTMAGTFPCMIKTALALRPFFSVKKGMVIIKQEGGKIISGASMKDVPNILWLEEIRKEDIVSVGGKGASLGEMASIGLPVPKSFVVTAQAFRRFLVETGIEKKIFA